VVDLKRLDDIVYFEPQDALVTVQAGMNGARLEAWLNSRGWTTGHHPQSLHMSTVGGWVACRGAGQSSTRYGKIEDMVQGCTVVLPDGRMLDIPAVARRSTGPSIKDIFVGSEGIFGVIVSVTLRIWPAPELRKPLVLAFPALGAGFDAIRQILHSEVRPAIVRLYDEHETAQRTQGQSPYDDSPVMAIMEFAGNARLVDLEYELARDVASKHGATLALNDYYETWLKHRYLSMSVGYQSKDWFADTIEVAGRWSALPAMHAQIVEAARAAHPALEFGAHWSHCYPEGACEYMTMRLPPMDDAAATEILFTLSDEIQDITLAHGGAISHHHGVGLLRGYKLHQELGIGLELVQALKDYLDPHGLFVPGKLGLAQRVP
jgi:alkyldihydroxyacetonephosphate synthase